MVGEEVGVEERARTERIARRNGLVMLVDGRTDLPEDLDRAYLALGRALLTAGAVRDLFIVPEDEDPREHAALMVSLAEAADEYQAAVKPLRAALWRLEGRQIRWAGRAGPSHATILAEILELWKGQCAWTWEETWPISAGCGIRPFGALEDADFLVESMARVEDELRRLADAREGEPVPPRLAPRSEGRSLPQCPSRSPDFRTVNHPDGRSFTFTPTQAACIKVMWEAWANGTPFLGQAAILEAAGSNGESLRDLFRSRKRAPGGSSKWTPHPALDALIIEGDTKGTFGLHLQLEPPAHAA